MRKNIIVTLLISILYSTALWAQSSDSSHNDKIDIKLRGRGLLDVRYQYRIVELRNINVFFSDLRIGVDAQYRDFHIRADVGFYDRSVILRDVYVEYQKRNHGFRIGNYAGHYLLDNIVESYDRPLHNVAQSVTYASLNRRLGMSYFYRNGRFSGWVDVFTSWDINNVNNKENGGGAVARGVVRLIDNANHLLHVGVAGQYQYFDNNITPQLDWRYDAPQGEEYGLAPELLWQRGRWRAQAEYIFGLLDNKMEPQENKYRNKQYSGGYAQLSFLLIGKNYGYNRLEGASERPIGRAWDVTARFDAYEESKRFADNSKSYNQYVSYSVGTSYYFNKYVGVSLDYTRVIEMKSDIANMRVLFIF